MACNNCMNGCIDPQMCSCDCTSCAEANSCDIPVGDVGPQGPPGPMGPPGTPCNPCTNGTDGLDGCSLLDVYISDGTDGNNTGDVIVTTGPTPPPCSQIINAGNIIDTITQGGASIPPGIIVMWHGAVALIPLGWVLCDGTNGTPDLRGRFIGAYGPDPILHAPFNGINGTGGANTVSLQQTNIPAHTHGIGSFNAVTTLVAVGNHNHGFDSANGNAGGEADKGGGGNSSPYWTYWAGGHNHVATTVLSGTSADGTPALSAPQGTAFTTIPKYWVLAFIMKQ